MTANRVRLGGARRRVSLGLAGAALTIAATLTGLPQTSCLLLSKIEKNQCSTTADCLAKGAEFSHTSCQDGVCVAGYPDGGVARAGSCTANADCLANPNTPNTYCDNQGRCAPITTADCKDIVTVDGNPITPDAIVLGILAPISGDSAPEGRGRVRAVMLAYREFLQFAVGIPSGPGTKPRPPALVICDQMVNAERAATHLAVDLKVPAIIGPGFSGTTLKVAKNVTIPNNVLLMTPVATSPDITTLQDNGLVWRTSTSFEPEAKAFADLLAQMETAPSVRTALGLASGAPIRVAVVAKGDSYGKGLAESMMTTLRFNGTDVAGNGDRFERLDFPDVALEPNPDTTAITNRIANEFKPHILLIVGTAEVITRGLGPIEEKWSTAPDAQPRPFAILAEGAKVSDLVAMVGATQSSFPERKLTSRLHVFGPRYNAALQAALATRYQGAYGEELPDVYGVAGSYDAFYVIAYALAATQTRPPSGPSIAAGLEQLVPPGLRIAAGPSDVSSALVELGAGRHIDYDGVVGPLDFNVTNGESLGDYNVYCVQPSGYQLTEQYYSTSSGGLVSHYEDCP